MKDRKALNDILECIIPEFIMNTREVAIGGVSYSSYTNIFIFIFLLSLRETYC